MVSQPSLLLVARRVIATSICYYSLDTSLVTDSEFDGWCRRLHDEWEDLDLFYRWKLGDPGAIKASGFHIKCVQRDIGGAIGWLRHKGLYKNRLRSNPKDWKDIPKSIQRLEGAPQAPARRVRGDFMSGRYTTVDKLGWNLKETIQ